MADRAQGEFSSSRVDTVHEWAMFRLLRRHVVSPHGEEFERTFVSTPGAVAVVGITPAGDVLFVSQFRASLNDRILEIPAGMRDVEGEDPSATAVRELREETGYSPSSIEFLGQCVSSPGVTDSRVEVYLATGLEAGQSEPHGPEEDHMEVVSIPFSSAIDMVMDGRITDAKSICGLLWAARKHPKLLELRTGDSRS